MTVTFGTDGWRAVISDTFTFDNLRLVSQAVADYLWANAPQNRTPSVVIGFDTRFLSDRYAAETARVMAANGIIAWLTRADCPTPAISYNVVHKNASLGIMITASHNPPRYNGLKLKGPYGGAATRAITTAVAERLAQLQTSGRFPQLTPYQAALDQDLIRRFDPAWPYYEHLTTRLIDLDIISGGELRVVADGMYGSGRGTFSEVLARTRTRVFNIRSDMNPGFGGIHPEPIARYLEALVAAVTNNRAHVGLATDGDADRIGAVDARGNFIDPHHIMALSLRYLVEHRGWRGAVVKTVSSTLMLNRLAKKYGLPLHETPVGFEAIAQLMMTDDVLIGGEESGGISIKGHIPEGDGVLMGLLLAELIAQARLPLHQLVADLQRMVGPTCYRRADIKLERPVPKADMVSRLANNAPATINNETVHTIKTHDGIKFMMADDSWLLIRPSGTEPVLRVYSEAEDETAVANILSAGRAMVGM
ncbi:MAG: phosphoglucomutase/phosphomannomutase family protein [Anaerolineae bacterium]